MAVSKRTRYEVLRRDNHCCRYCGGRAPDVALTVDHVTPVALGGTDAPSNLVAACKDCNAGKSSTSPDAALVEDVKQADLVWAAAMKRAAAAVAAEREVDVEWAEALSAIWGPRWMPDDFMSTLGSFRASGLPLTEMQDAAHVAIGARGVDDRWRYFCGVAWRKVAKMQEIAKAIIEAESAGES